MKILYISKYAAVPVSGHPTRQYFFSKCLAEFGNSVMLIYSNSNGLQHNGQDSSELTQEIDGYLLIQKLKGPSIALGMNLKRIWSWMFFEYQIFKNLRRIKDFQPDIIIVSSLSILTFLSGVYLKKLLKRPLVLEVRDLYPLTLIEIGGFSKYNPIVQILGVIEKYGYKNADLILSTLENTRNYFETRKSFISKRGKIIIRIFRKKL